MSTFGLTILLAAVLALLLVAVIGLLLSKRRVARRIVKLNDELIATSGDASVGRRLSTAESGDVGRLAATINKLFDALAERDEVIQDRDRMFVEFARTLPEIVLVHDEKILLANESAANLIGVSAGQLEGREAADLVKPA